MKRETIENILNFLKEKEGKELPYIWVRLLEEEKLIQELENHPDGTQYRYDGRLELKNTNIKKLPKDFYVGNSLFLSGCEQLTELPDKLHVSGRLDLDYCTQITELPNDLYVRMTFSLMHTKITKLPDNLYVGGRLIIKECAKLKKLPKNLFVGDDLYIGNIPLSKKYTDEQIYEMVASTGGKIKGKIYRQ